LERAKSLDNGLETFGTQLGGNGSHFGYNTTFGYESKFGLVSDKNDCHDVSKFGELSQINPLDRRDCETKYNSFFYEDNLGFQEISSRCNGFKVKRYLPASSSPDLLDAYGLEERLVYSKSVDDFLHHIAVLERYETRVISSAVKSYIFAIV